MPPNPWSRRARSRAHGFFTALAKVPCGAVIGFGAVTFGLIIIGSWFDFRGNEIELDAFHPRPLYEGDYINVSVADVESVDSAENVLTIPMPESIPRNTPMRFTGRLSETLARGVAHVAFLRRLDDNRWLTVKANVGFPKKEVERGWLRANTEWWRYEVEILSPDEAGDFEVEISCGTSTIARSTAHVE